MRTLHNPTKQLIEFGYGGQVYFVEAGKTKDFEDKVVAHCVKHVNNALVEVVEELEEASVELPTDINEMDWNELRKHAKGVYKPGMTREEVLEALNEGTR